jgi:hypothetical protein
MSQQGDNRPIYTGAYEENLLSNSAAGNPIHWMYQSKTVQTKPPQDINNIHHWDCRCTLHQKLEHPYPSVNNLSGTPYRMSSASIHLIGTLKNKINAT